MTITINENVGQSTIDRVFKLLDREKVPFTFQSATQERDDEDAVKTAAIRERLRLKYVVSGKWSTMDDEERQDAALLEGMLYDDDNENVELLSETEQIEFRNEMKNWAKQ